jgi:hypothetical protein
LDGLHEHPSELDREHEQRSEKSGFRELQNSRMGVGVCMQGGWRSRLTHCWADEEFIILILILLVVMVMMMLGEGPQGRWPNNLCVEVRYLG